MEMVVFGGDGEREWWQWRREDRRHDNDGVERRIERVERVVEGWKREWRRSASRPSLL